MDVTTKDRIGMGENIYQIPGLKRILPLLDVIFVYQEGKLHHFIGHLGGWEIYKRTEMPEEYSETYIKNWLESL